MRKISVEYYRARAQRERDLASCAVGWMAPLHIATAERFERWASRLLGEASPPRPQDRREPPSGLDGVAA